MCNDDRQAGLPAGAFPGGGALAGEGAFPGGGEAHPVVGPQATGQPAPDVLPQAAGEAVDLMLAGLGWLANADLASVPVAVQADCLRALERAASLHTAARAATLSAFDAAAGYEDDGVRSAKTWLRWQTQVTGAAASGSVGWMRRLRAHPVVADALRDGRISASWAREFCDWTDRLPEEARGDADRILLGAAAGGAELADLARLAEVMRRRLAEADSEGDDGFEDRQLRLQTTLGGAGRLDGDLTPRCAAAVQAVLDALGKKAGPEDTRTQRQRHHDALEEACRRLIASGGLPDRAGQSTQIQLHLTLDELNRLESGADGIIDHARSARPEPSHAGFFASPASPGDVCDATIVPIVTGQVDLDLLDRLTAKLTSKTGGVPERGSVRDLILANAVSLLSGPGHLTSLLRTGSLAGPAASISLPLDLGTAAESIPPHLRRAVILRDRHCAAPGCFQPPSGCQVHHTTPRSKGGRTKLTELILLCPFHHLIVVHTWGWSITLNPDGTTTMTNPSGTKVYHSHSPPPATAA